MVLLHSKRLILCVPDEGHFQKRVVRTKFDIYVFTKTAVSFIQQSLELRKGDA